MTRPNLHLLALTALVRLATASGLECGPASVDLGIVAQGRILTVDRTCRNTGTREIQIQEIATGCTCLGASVEKPTLVPGARTRLRLRLETAPLADKVEFAVEIPYRSKDSSSESMIVSADVRPSVVAFPEYLDMGDFRKTGVRQILVVDTTGGTFGIKQSTTARSEVEVRWTQVELVRMGDKWQHATHGGAVTGYEVTVQSRPGSTRRSLSDEIQLELVHDLQKTLRIRVVGYSP
jgi:hypothetical protein